MILDQWTIQEEIRKNLFMSYRLQSFGARNNGIICFKNKITCVLLHFVSHFSFFDLKMKNEKYALCFFYRFYVKMKNEKQNLKSRIIIY